MTKNHTASRVQGKFSIFFTAKCNMDDNGALQPGMSAMIARTWTCNSAGMYFRTYIEQITNNSNKGEKNTEK